MATYRIVEIKDIAITPIGGELKEECIMEKDYEVSKDGQLIFGGSLYIKEKGNK